MGMEGLMISCFLIGMLKLITALLVIDLLSPILTWGTRIMEDFEQTVTIKLVKRMQAVQGVRSIQMKAIESIEVYRHNKRKPVAILVNDTRPGVLRDLADWIEHSNDPMLYEMEEAMNDGS